MLRIKQSEPWIMWPDSIVSQFIEFPANKIFDYTGNYKFILIFELNEGIEQKKTVFAKLPTYFGIDLVPDGCILIYRYENATETYYSFKDTSWSKNKAYYLVIEKIDNQLLVSVNGEPFFDINLLFTLGKNDNSHIIFGAGNFPKNGFNLNYLDFNLQYLSIEKDGIMISEHNFETFIHDKSFDLTNNCNFLHKL